MAAAKGPDLICAQAHHIANVDTMLEKLAQFRRKGWQAAAGLASRMRGGTSAGTVILCSEELPTSVGRSATAAQ
eukprot:7603948-Lingulodinium_polyedra.AAC.1